MSKKVPTGPVAERSDSGLLPSPLGEGRGGGSGSEPFSARSPHPNLPPAGEGANTTQQATRSPSAPTHPSVRPQPSPTSARPEPVEGLTNPAAHSSSAPTHPSARPEPVEGLTKAATRPSPLATLNTHIAQATQLARQQITPTTGEPHTAPWPTLRSAQRFHETWSRISAETEVAKAEQRAPDNAGPLNSHKLVLHTLSLMRSLSPDYLGGFLAQAETLLWLEQAHALPRQQVAGKGGAVRKKK